MLLFHGCILKDGEIDIRCGVRAEPAHHESLLGDVVFNTHSPSYIQLKYKRGLSITKGMEADSMVNIVADKINLISHMDKNFFNLTDQDELIKNSEIEDIMKKLHQVPYGDVLIDVLQKIINAIVNHVHPYPGLPACLEQHILTVNSIDLTKILSENVRIS